uniref:(northern house mosquito) hypothetical protein n=1 Tax=Culex pipiens TaxID=7175 RepID=A0A8D8N4Z4_CULPI
MLRTTTTTRKVFGLQCCLQTSRTIALCITAAGLSRVQDDGDDEGQQTAEEHLRVQSFTELLRKGGLTFRHDGTPRLKVCRKRPERPRFDPQTLPCLLANTFSPAK